MDGITMIGLAFAYVLAAGTASALVMIVACVVFNIAD